jgi:hypothetical protein
MQSCFCISFRAVLDKLAFEYFDGLQGGGDADGVAAEGRSVRARFPVHQVCAGDRCANRQAASDALRNANDVGLESVMV